MTKQIMVGGVAVGGGAPVTIQSMCNTKTEDAGATIEQILRLEQAGCEIVRVTVPTPEAAEAVETIKNSIHIPLVADIHFDYRLAIAAADIGVAGGKGEGLIFRHGEVLYKVAQEKLLDALLEEIEKL